jgi:hypothetical protein
VFANLNSGVATIAVPSNQAANGTNVFTAVYQGDANYNSAASNPVNVTVTQSDFSFTTQNPALSISLAGSGTSMLMLTPINGFSGSVTLTVSAPTGITATPATATPAVSASTSDVLTINVAPTMAVGTYPLTITASGGGHVHTAQIQVQVLLVAAPVFSPVAGNYTTPQAVSISDAAAGAVVYYTTNGNAPTSSSTLYTGPITVSAVAETIKAIAFVTGQGPSAVTTAAYTILPLAATPTFSLASGEYKSSQTLTIADTTPGIVIHYTTDGTTPTINSTVYTGPITVWSAVPLTETVQAIATGNGYTASPAFSATYTLMPLVPTPTFTPPAGAYTNAQTVTISTIAPSPTIYYTTDGSAPNTSSPKYTGPITVSMSETVQAFAGSSGYGNSIIASASYTIASSMTAQPTFSLAGGEYKSAQTLIISDTTPGALIHYTSDGTTPTVNSPFYSGPITIWSSVPLTETIQAIATANGYVPSAVTTATYVLMPLVNTPTFSPAPGSYATGQTVTIYDTTPGAIIYYTIDGTAPNTSSPKYNGPISVPGTEVLQAFAGSSGYGNSVIVSGTYTIASSITAAPTFSLASGTYKYAQTLTISDTTPGAIIHYTTDGTTPTASSTVYAGPITVWSTVPVTEVVQAIASTSGYTNSPVTSATYLLMPLVATPTFTPTAGTYTSAQSVIISTTTPNATIYYTIDGTAPSTASTKYTSPITVSASETIQTFAGSPGYGNSLVVSAPYIINSSSGTSIIAPRAPIAPSRPLIGPSPRLSD